MYARGYRASRLEKISSVETRLLVMGVLFGIGGLILILRFFQLQVLEHHTYQVLASDQHEIQASLVPRRGTIYVKDRLDGQLYPIAKDRDSWLVYAILRELKDVTSTAQTLSNALHVDPVEMLQKLSSTSSNYVAIDKDATLEAANALRAAHLPGIGVSKSLARLYPEEGIGGQIIGFVSTEDKNQRTGKYGTEGAYDTLLAGEPGSLVAEKDAAGRMLTIGTLDLKQAKNGSDVVLTIDRVIQFTACKKIQDAVKEFEAVSGSIIIMNPQTGGILAMCSTPDFDPKKYGQISDIGVLNNPAISYQFEPGSIFKPLTMSAGIDLGKIGPETTYNDRGEETMDGFTIHNSDLKAHGIQTMTDVLDKSLNTGTIFVERLIGVDAFRKYIEAFGLGQKTEIGFQAEAKGDISALSRKGKIFTATASFGQGISATPIQMLTAFAALGNGGKLIKPYIVQEKIYPDGTREEIKPQVVRQVMSERTSRLISAMMVNVVEQGHGKRAGVPGYYVAGKTGTAQIPNPRGGGYLEDATIGSFAGFAPADNPKFVMIVKIDRPKTVSFAESSAAPVFGEMAKFLLTYLQVPPERPTIQSP